MCWGIREKAGKGTILSQHTDKGELGQYQAEEPQPTMPVFDRALPEVDELQLVLRAKAGEQEAFGLLVQRHGKAVLNLIDKMMRDRNIVEDLWQETFVRALENLHIYEPRTLTGSGTGPSFVSWLYRIASNLTLDELRRRGRWRMFSWSSFKPRHTDEPDTGEDYDPPSNQPDTVAVLESRENIQQVRRH